MKKIRLDADDLQVLSFATAGMPGVRGTAKAAETGNPCYETVGYHQTLCLAYPESYWKEDTCDCISDSNTDDARCTVDSAYVTCHTCPGEPGC